MDAFVHDVYQYNKGMRQLILHTVPADRREACEKLLNRYDISYEIRPVGDREKINIFAGDNRCVEVIRAIGKSSLTEYTPEEDFILGVMLGYGTSQQCERYLELKAQDRVRNLSAEGLILPRDGKTGLEKNREKALER